MNRTRQYIGGTHTGVPPMPSFTIERHIDAPGAETFAVFSDLQSAPDRIKEIVSLEVLTDGPVGAGTRFRETRIMMKKEATEEMEISDWRPGEGYVVTCDSCGCHYETKFSFSPSEKGTLVRMQMDTTPVTLSAKILGPAMNLFFGGMMRRCMEKDLDPS